MTKKLADFLQGHASTTRARQGTSRGYRHDVFDFIQLIQRWPDIIGPHLAAETIPLKNRHGVLTVLTHQPAFSEQIKFMEEPLKKKIEDVFPTLKGKMKRINFICNPQAFMKEREKAIHHQIKSKPQKLAIHPQSPTYKKWLSEAQGLFDLIEDEELKRDLESLYIQSKMRDQD